VLQYKNWLLFYSSFVILVETEKIFFRVIKDVSGAKKGAWNAFSF
jgi:hypothetical protein